MWGAFDVWAVVVTWRRRWASLASSAAGDVAWLAVLAWLGAGDVASSAVVVGVVGAGDVASVGGVVGGVWGP